MSDIEFLSKLQQGAQMIADACSQKLEGMSPPRRTTKPNPARFDTLPWETKTGGKGPYQQTSKQTSNNSELFQTLQNIMKEKNGFTQMGQYKYWNHQGDVDVIDRRGKT